ncbi:hypothetical protein SK128_009708 [Halocaridina rubra]|uniref:Methyltransferase FkbM domain-containing protein n=1 Tax=Halocaridina rubra TaxID=373956 RepID=A0AAN8XLF7_HALRR
MKLKYSFKEGFGVRTTQSCRLWIFKILAMMFFIVIFVSTQIPRYSGYLLRSLQGPIDPDDSELLDYIRNEILEPPSNEPYNLLGKSNVALLSPDDSEHFYREVLEIIFKDKRGGFFVEAGALDGETMSNTLNLERDQDWTGLLVEPDKLDYEALRTKNRKAWSANVCLSPSPYPSKEMLSQHIHYAGPMAVRLGFKMRAMHALASYSSQKTIGNSWFAKVQCIPLESLLYAMNVSRIDLLVLDVEGAELDIFKHFDLAKFDVQVICMEWKKTDQLDRISKNLERKGYKEVARNLEDLVVIKKGSPYMPKQPLTLTTNYTTASSVREVKMGV